MTQGPEKFETSVNHCTIFSGVFCFSWGFDAPGDSLHSLAAGCPYLRKLFLTALRGITDRDIEPFIEHCRDLEQVDLMGGRGITSEICVKLVACMFLLSSVKFTCVLILLV